MKILFVCSSNVCRSPYCEYLFRRMVDCDEKLRGKIEVKSAAVVNRSKEIFPMAAVALENEGFGKQEIAAHKPSYKRADMKRFEDADVIVGMSKMHRLFTPRRFRSKFITLSEAATGRYKAIPDPFLARSQEKYDAAMRVIKDYLVEYFKRLKSELG